jgi:hypothetical protein
LVGLKKDLREDLFAKEKMLKKGPQFINPSESAELARLCGAVKYLECSSLNGEGVDDLFKVATRMALLTVNRRENKDGRCIIL